MRLAVDRAPAPRQTRYATAADARWATAHPPGVAGQHGVLRPLASRLWWITAMTCWVCCWVSFFPPVHAQRHALALGNQQAHQRNHLLRQQGSVQPIDRPLRHRPGVGPRRQLRHLRPVGAVQAAVQQRLEDGVLAVEMAYSPPLDRPQRWAMSSIRAAVKPRRENSCNAASSICGTRCAGARRNLRLG